jgi:DNA-binding MarR family transcriptional regulator
MRRDVERSDTLPSARAKESLEKKPAVGLWVRLAKCYALVLREVRDAPGNSALTLAQFDVLAQLLRHPEGMTPGDLSEALLVTAGNITGLVDRLEAQDLVTKRTAKDDARVRIVRLTARGKRLAVREVARHERLLSRVFSDLRVDEQLEISETLDRMRVALEKRA